MFKVSLQDRPEFLAGDHTRLRELFHPAKHSLAVGYSLAQGTIQEGGRSLWHRLTSAEVYYFIAGTGEFHLDDEVQPIGPGCTVYVPPGAKQCVTNTGVGVIEFLCLVEPAWRLEDEVVLE
ncbi:MAG: cupin domain-containing protein [Nitrospiraceae bacterium]